MLPKISNPSHLRNVHTPRRLPRLPASGVQSDSMGALSPTPNDVPDDDELVELKAIWNRLMGKPSKSKNSANPLDKGATKLAPSHLGPQVAPPIDLTGHHPLAWDASFMRALASERHLLCQPRSQAHVSVESLFMWFM